MGQNEKEITKILDFNMREYARTVISERAIPSIVDGLKPTLRRSLYTSHKYFNGRRTKVNMLAGRTVEFVPTGDSGIVGAISNASRQWPGSNNFALFKPTGSVGSRVFSGGSSIAAPRYLSVELSDFTREVLFADKEIWDMISNYDESGKEIRHFYPILPVCLINGIHGIAFSVATQILPHNPKDLAVVVEKIFKGTKTIKDPLPWFRGFKGTVLRDNVKYNRFIIYGKLTQKSSNTWLIEDLPVGMSHDKMITRLEQLKSSRKIVNYEDKCTDIFEFTVKTGRNQYTHGEMVDLLRLKKKVVQNINVLDQDGNLVTYKTVVDMLRDFVKLRKLTFERLKKFKVETLREEAWILETKIKAIILGVHKTQFLSRKELVDLVEGTNIRQKLWNRSWAEKVADMPLHHFSSEHREKMEQEKKEIEDKMMKWYKLDIEKTFKKRLKEVQSMI